MNQSNLTMAHHVANQLQEALEADDDEMDVLSSFHSDMSAYRQDSYAHLEIAGIGIFHETFVWWMSDNSIVLVGWKADDEVVIGVLPPDTDFRPAIFQDGEMKTLH